VNESGFTRPVAWRCSRSSPTAAEAVVTGANYVIDGGLVKTM
jgi:hypothetical protein